MRGPAVPDRPAPLPPVLGIVIPTLDEEESLPLLLGDLSGLSVPHEIVVADGGSADGTREAARSLGARVVSTRPGRARQMNGGAALTRAPWLLFLHADVRLPGPTLSALEAHLGEAGPRDVGWFAFSLQGDDRFWRFIEMGQRLREGLGGLVYGDQGLLVSRALFAESGGYPDLPLMEDVALFRELRRAGRPRKIPAPLLSSPRRYQKVGRWRGWLRNTALITLFLAGVPPERLSRFYPSRRGSPGIPDPDRSGPDQDDREAGSRDVLLVFGKDPVPGKVKTRLAAGVGKEEAALIYRKMGRRVVDQLRGGPYRTVICFDPPEALERVGSWLDGRGIELVPQSPGDLGARLESAFRKAFQEGERVVVVGTDAPDVDEDAVVDAFRLLEEAELVVGPARDGGYYLLGLNRPAPELFREIPWSTELVLETTLARADELDLTLALLPPLPDVDTAEDWRALDKQLS